MDLFLEAHDQLPVRPHQRLLRFNLRYDGLLRGERREGDFHLNESIPVELRLAEWQANRFMAALLTPAALVELTTRDFLELTIRDFWNCAIRTSRSAWPQAHEANSPPTFPEFLMSVGNSPRYGSTPSSPARANDQPGHRRLATALGGYVGNHRQASSGTPPQRRAHRGVTPSRPRPEGRAHPQAGMPVPHTPEVPPYRRAPPHPFRSLQKCACGHGLEERFQPPE